MKREEIVQKEEEMESLGESFARTLKSNTIVVLEGTLGAGKTVFVRGIAKALGITEPIVSPTFTLVQQYKNGVLPLYHLDLYRLGEIDEFDLIDGREILSSKGVVCIEWPQLIKDYLRDDNTVYVSININDDKSRTVLIETKGSFNR